MGNSPPGRDGHAHLGMERRVAPLTIPGSRRGATALEIEVLAVGTASAFLKCEFWTRRKEWSALVDDFRTLRSE
jgi:hypothetical protein